MIEAVAVKALFPHEPTRRAFLKSVGKGTALAAIASVLPLSSLQEAAAIDVLKPEKKSVDIGFLPILCSTPLIMADPLGYYEEQGIKANLHKRAGWALVRDQMMNRELDATHFLAPMPLAISLGLGSAKQDMKVAAIQNTNGQALVMALKHANNRDPRNWKGFTFAIPFEHSIHNYLLRYFLAEHGLDPDKDVKLRLTTPPDMIANLKAGNIDGFFGPEPFNQRAVWDKAGYIHTLSRDIWLGHPCCSFGTSQSFINENPQTFLAMYRAIIKANVLGNEPSIRKDLSKLLSPAKYLGQPELLLMDEPFGALDALTRGVIQDELVNIVDETQQTVFMITHDIDEAILLADRIFLMSNGPRAFLAEIVENTIPRPRHRDNIHPHAHYYKIRNHLLDFLVHRSKALQQQSERPSHPKVINFSQMAWDGL